MLGVGGVGLFRGRGHLQSRENNGKSRENNGKTMGNQGKSRGKQEESRENKGKSRGVKGNQEESRGVKGIFIVRESYVYEGMFMYGCMCFFG